VDRLARHSSVDRQGNRRSEAVATSYAQEQIWLLDRLNAVGAAYNVSTAFKLYGPLRLDCLEAAWQVVLGRHDVLRSSFRTSGGRPVCRINRRFAWPVIVDDVTDIRAPEREREAHRRVTSVIRQPFKLTTPPLGRVHVIRMADQEHMLVLVFHHAIIDGWSLGIVKRELGSAYDSIIGGRTPSLPPLKLCYAEATQRERTALEGGELETDLRYWREQLQALPALSLPLDRRRPPIQSFRGGKAAAAVQQPVVEQLEAFAQELHVSLFMVLTAAFAILLWRRTGQTDIPIGAPVANRTEADCAGIVGPFVNSVTLRVDASGDPSFLGLVKRVSRVTLDALEHQRLPFEHVVRDLAPERTLSHNPLFQVMFALQTVESDLVRMSDVETTLVDRDTDTTRFDLDWTLWRRRDGIEIQLLFNTDIFDRDTATGLLWDYQAILSAVAALPERPISQALPVRRSVASTMSATQPRGSADCTLHELFEMQVLRSPDAIAVETSSGKLSYRQLNRHADAIAQALVTCGVAAEERVGLCCDRTHGMVAAVLGSWKAGAAVVPLDPRDPPERTRLLLRDSGAKVVVSDGSLHPSAADNVKVLSLTEIIANRRVRPPSVAVSPSQLAYLIYTSGTSGWPKGVLIEHRNAAHTLLGCHEDLDITEEDAFLVLASYTFDIFFFELLMPLICGGRAIVVSRDELFDPHHMLALMQRASCMQAVPGLMRELLRILDRLDAGTAPGFRYVFTGGDAVPGELLRDMGSAFPDAELWVLYGPTEAAMVCTGYRVPTIPTLDGHPIGRPLPGVVLRICDENGQMVANGVTGELWIGGGGLARGYLNLDGQSQAAFVTSNGARFYRSGDLCRVHRTRGLEFLGRTDDQVKIRGFRVEPLEVEVLITEHPEVQEAAVVVEGVESETREIAAYIVPAQSTPPDALKEEELEFELTDQWQGLFEDTHTAKGTTADADFTGWHSSYSGAALPMPELIDWRDAIVRRIVDAATKDGRQTGELDLLEVGSGTGLLGTELAPRFSRYVGTDFSSNVLTALAERFARRLPGTDIELVLADAAEVTDRVDGNFDIIVVNSVIQYLPSARRARLVLGRLLDRLRPGGTLVIGDVRSLPLLEAFHAGVMATRREVSMADTQAALARLRQRVASEQELVLAPRFFQQLAAASEAVDLLETIPRANRYDNEMSRYRYDVVMHAAKCEVAEPPDGLDWTADQLDLSRLKKLLSRSRPEGVTLRQVPNAHIDSDLRMLNELGFDLSVPDEQPSIHPYALLAVAQTLNYRAVFSWAGESRRGAFDVALIRRDQPVACVRWSESAESGPVANQPVRSLLDRRREERISRHLTQLQPSHLVPRRISTLESLPLTENGKVNRAALRGIRHAPRDVSRAPASPAEKVVAEIWGEVLGGEKLSVGSNFFDHGGTSLLAIQAAIGLRARGFQVTAQSVFLFQTVEEMATAIESTNVATDVEQPRVSRTGLTPATHSDLRSASINTLAESQSILVTGATGFLGIYLLAELLSVTDCRIVCLAHAVDERAAASQLAQALDGIGLDAGRTMERIEVLPGDLRAPQLGLRKPAWALASNCEHIFNVAADVRHTGDPRDLFEVNHAGARRVLQLAAAGRHKAIHHVSSLGVVGVLDHDSRETFTESDLNIGQRFSDAYSASKFAAEQGVREFVASGGHATVARIGTIAPHSITGHFQRNIADHFLTRYVRSIVCLGIAAAWPRQLRLCPVDVVARCLVVIADDHGSRGGTFHVDSPYRLSHTQLVGALRQYGYDIDLGPSEGFEKRAFQLARDKNLEERLDGLIPFIDSNLRKGPRPDVGRSVAWLRERGIEFPRPTRAWLAKFFDHCSAVGFLPPPDADHG
jgi:amino acid adenylation domain-containing protein/thioester reductase-like protein